MSDVISKHLRKKVVVKNEVELEKHGISLPDRSVVLSKFETEFRLSPQQRHYLGDISLIFESIIRKAEFVHNHMIDSGSLTIGTCSWEIDYTFEYYSLLRDINGLLPWIRKFSKRKRGLQM